MSKIFVVPPKSDWIRLEGNDLLKYLKDHKLAPSKATEPQVLYHIDALSHEVRECTVVGYVDQWTTVIDIDGYLDCIHPDYLVEMQQGRKRSVSNIEPSSLSNDQVVPIAQSSDRYCVFDVETPNRSNDRISSIGVTVIQSGEIVDSKSYLVNPEVPFAAYNTQLTGIDSQLVKDAPTFPQVWEDIHPLFDGAILVAHSARFDLSVLRKTLAAYHIPAFQVKYLCTLELSQNVFPNLEKYRLNNVCDYLGIPLDHHQASSDSLACANILQHIISIGTQVNNYIQSYDLGEVAETDMPQSSRNSHCNANTIALNELIEMLSNISAEDQLTLVEVSELASWMDKHAELKDQEPFDQVFAALNSAMLDGFLSPHEKKELLALFQTIVDPVPQFADSIDALSVSGKFVCLTGNFEKYSRNELEQKLKSLGAIIKTSVVKDLDYLIVGGQGSDSWRISNYGTKIQRAIKLKEEGFPVKIILESDFFPALETSHDEFESSKGQSTETDIVDTLSSSSQCDKPLEQRCFEAIKYYLADAGYDSDKVALSLRTPDKGDPYYVIEMLGHTCFHFKGKVKRKLSVAPILCKHFEPFGFIPTKSNDPKIWRAIQIDDKTDFSIMRNAFIETYEYCLRASAEGFDCCSRYMECSNVRTCIHPDKQFAGGCSYRKKLRTGIIFFGQNRNI